MTRSALCMRKCTANRFSAGALVKAFPNLKNLNLSYTTFLRDLGALGSLALNTFDCYMTSYTPEEIQHLLEGLTRKDSPTVTSLSILYLNEVVFSSEQVASLIGVFVNLKTLSDLGKRVHFQFLQDHHGQL